MSLPPKPNYPRPSIDGIPAELKALRQWVLWCAAPDERDKNWTKVPYQVNRKKASCGANGGRTWTDFKTAHACLLTGGWADGIGFVFTKQETAHDGTETGDPYCGLDFDHVRDPKTGDITPWARAVIDSVASYSEVSASGTGVHVILKGKLPKGSKHKISGLAPGGVGAFEDYDCERYFTMTGVALSGAPTTIEARQPELEAALARLYPHADVVDEAPQGEDLPDAKVLAVADAENPEAFEELFKRANIARYDDDHSKADFALTKMLIAAGARSEAQIDRLFSLSALAERSKWKRKDYRTRTIKRALEAHAKESTGQEEKKSRKSASVQAFELVPSRMELFVDTNRDAYATVENGGHMETHAIRSFGFRNWLMSSYHKAHGKILGAQARSDTLYQVEAEANQRGIITTVHLRVAAHGPALYIDRGTPDFSIIEVTSAGYKVIPYSACPVRFRHGSGIGAMPLPEPGGTLDHFRQILQMNDDELTLLLAFAIGAFGASGGIGALAHLQLVGEPGAGKSTKAKLIKYLIDPGTIHPLRDERPPMTDPRNFASAAKSNYLLSFGNLTHISNDVSNLMCCFSTGARFGERELYTNFDETGFEAQRPIVWTAVEDLGPNADLNDRMMTIRPQELTNRLTDEDFWQMADTLRPRLLGLLLDALVYGRRHPVKLINPPRMADFAQLAASCMPAFGIEANRFLELYADNRIESNEKVLDASPLYKSIAHFAQQGWAGTAQQLREHIARYDEEYARSKKFPETAWWLSNKLNSIKANLLKDGIEVTYKRGSDRNRSRLIKLSMTNPTAKPAKASNGRGNEEVDELDCSSLSIPEDGYQLFKQLMKEDANGKNH